MQILVLCLRADNHSSFCNNLGSRMHQQASCFSKFSGGGPLDPTLLLWPDHSQNAPSGPDSCIHSFVNSFKKVKLCRTFICIVLCLRADNHSSFCNNLGSNLTYYVRQTKPQALCFGFPEFHYYIHTIIHYSQS